MPTLNKTTGFHNFRLKDPKNYKESIFAREWENFLKNNPRILNALLNVDGVKPAPEPSEKDCQIVATTIQFLGTREGQFFIRQALKKCGE